MNPYSYVTGVPCSNVQLKRTTRTWLLYTVDFRTAHPTRHEENNTVRGEYFRPRHSNDDLPLIILIHGMGDRSVIPCKLLARSLAKRGIACFILYLVLHSSRMPPGGLSSLTSDDWVENYRISVIDVRQVIDWAATRPEINERQLAVIGISFGGFISAITMAVDKRIRASVLLTTAGNLEKIAKLSKTLPKEWGHSNTEAEFNSRQSRYAQYLDDVAKKGLENVSPTENGFLNDPMTFAYYLRKRPMLMINALWDEVIPKQATLDFWGACDKPAIAWFPGGHATIWLWYPLIFRKIICFLRSSLGL